jgi:peptide/nickel transport system substrate-binding protein
VRSTGDGFLAIFDSAGDAVGCAESIQRDLAAQVDGIRVRIGLNTGDVFQADGEVFGAAVNLAARVMDRARGGQVLATDTVRQAAGTAPDARFRDRGRVALQGFPGRQRLFEVGASVGRPRRAAARRRHPAVLAAATAVAIAAAAAALAMTGGEGEVEVRSNSVAILDPDDGEVLAQVPVGVRPADLAVGGGSVWVANVADGTVSQIGTRSRSVAHTVTPGIAVDGLAVGQGGLWVADGGRGVVRMIDPQFHSVARSLRVGRSVIARPVAVGEDAVWTVAGSGNRIARLDPRTERPGATIPVGNGPSSVVIGAGAVWVGDSGDGTVSRIDPRTNKVVATIAVGQSVSAIAVGAGGVWVTVPLEDRVKRIDPASNDIAESVRVSGGPTAAAIGAGGIWVTSARAGTVTRLDPARARVTRTIHLGHSPQGVAIVAGAVWVSLQPSPARASTTRTGEVLRVLRPEPLYGTDPAVTWGAEQVFAATCALLLTHPDKPFPAGATLVPEVARELPTVSDDGRTYRFRLRSGFRFSPPSGAPVTAEAFRRAIERVGHPKAQSFAADWYLTDVVGYRSFRSGRAEHVAGVKARANTLTIRLTAPSATLPARLASTFFCAVPPNTPVSAAGLGQIPMAGPYAIASYTPKRRLVLRRNPNYGGTRPARFREIQVDLDVPAARAVAAVEAGRADYVSAVPPEQVPSLERRYGPDSRAARAGGQRYFSSAEAVVHYFALNTRRPLFARKRLRQAVNEALDRRALAHRVFGGDPGAPGRPTDQFIPPGLPGFRDAAIYPLGDPDLARARRLAGDRHRRAVLYTCNQRACTEQARAARRSLAAIGLDLAVEQFSLEEGERRVKRPGEPWDLAYRNWFLDYADPSFVAEMFSPGPAPYDNPGGFDDRRLVRQIRAATRLREPDARVDAFAQLDADLARAAAGAPFATAVSTDFFSDRIGCQVERPISGMSLGALCVRG